jgi:hypothetical protein
MSGELVAILDGRETGRVVQDDRGRLFFTYNEAWRTAEDAHVLIIVTEEASLVLSAVIAGSANDLCKNRKNTAGVIFGDVLGALRSTLLPEACPR